MIDNIGDPPCKNCIALPICKSKLDLNYSDPYKSLVKDCNLIREFMFASGLVNGRYMLYKEPRATIRDRLNEVFNLQLKWSDGRRLEVKIV